MNDYISRQAVLEMLEKSHIISNGEYSGYCTEDIDICDIPAANVQPVKFGKDVCGLITDRHCEYKCSLCGFEMLEAWCDNEFNYCPNCGAKMEMEDK